MPVRPTVKAWHGGIEMKLAIQSHANRHVILCVTCYVRSTFLSSLLTPSPWSAFLLWMPVLRHGQNIKTKRFKFRQTKLCWDHKISIWLGEGSLTLFEQPAPGLVARAKNSKHNYSGSLNLQVQNHSWSSQKYGTKQSKVARALQLLGSDHSHWEYIASA